MYLSKKISNALTDVMIQNNVIPKDEKELYVYCYDFVLEQILYIAIILIIGILCNKFSITLIFLLTFLPMRAFGGGIHAPTETACTILSFAVYESVLLFSPVIAPQHSVLWLIGFAASIFITIMLAPVDTANKRLSQEHKKQKKKQYFFFCLLLILSFCIFYCKKMQLYYGTLAICVILISISMFLGGLVNWITLWKKAVRPSDIRGIKRERE